jgi:outer membrane protein
MPHVSLKSRISPDIYRSFLLLLMSSKVRSTLLAVAALAISIPSLQAQGGPAKVAIINAAKAVADTAEIQKAQAALQAKYKPRQQAIDDLQKQLAAIQQQASTPNIAADKEAQLRSDFTQKQKQLQRLGEDLQADVNAERQDILGKAGRQMSEIVKKIAEEKNIDVVVDVTNTIYFKPTLEITADATAAYNKAYPVAN